jgi:hypothetical protein
MSLGDPKRWAELAEAIAEADYVFAHNGGSVGTGMKLDIGMLLKAVRKMQRDEENRDQ